MVSREVTLSILFIIGLVKLSSSQNSAPRFIKNLFSKLTEEGINEGTQLGAIIGQLSCTDSDVHDTLTYRGEGQTLSVDSLGTVRLIRELDTDAAPVSSNEVQPLLQAFYCTDQTGLSASVKLQIRINDVNDNAPRFISNSAHSTRIREDAKVGTTLPNLNLYLKDPDKGLNSVVDFSCFEGDPIDSQSVIACEHFNVSYSQLGQGEYNASIHLRKTVDYETTRGYAMTLMAKDRGTQGQVSLSSSVNILIEVEDTQDSDPEFLNIPLTLYVEENSVIGSHLATLISAQDQDLGSPRPVVILMENDEKGLFRIGDSLKLDPTKAYYSAPVIVNDVIDREVLSNIYTFTVKAVELDENGLQTNSTVSAIVTVNIQDQNDHKPYFNNTEFSVSIAERDSNSSQTNSQVPNLNILIVDRDEASNAFFEVLISSQTHPGTFRLFPEGNVTGSVGVNLLIQNSNALDYDNPNNRKHIVMIQARELRTENPETSSATVTINLIDINDNYPIFSREKYVAYLREDAAVNTPINIQINATDEDEGNNGRIVYSLRGTDADIQTFRVDPATGNIFLDQKINFEVQTEYPMLIVATDQGAPNRETTRPLTIYVSDFNDLGPRFFQLSYQTYAFETNTDLLPPVQVKAEDPENPEHGIIKYTIVDGNINNNFGIDPDTGKLSLLKLLDYDQTPGRKGIFVLIVQAEDSAGVNGLKTNTTITVNVQDENNHIPVFNQTIYTRTISEVEPTGTRLVTVSARDLDFGRNGELRYNIDRGGLDNFEITSIGGVISVSPRAQFDYESKDRYDLMIYAVDRGSPPQTGTATVYVNIIDANNKSPVMPKLIYNRRIRDDADIGTPVIQINATDVDSNSLLRYDIPIGYVQARDSDGKIISRISPFDYREAFTVNAVTGIVTTKSKLSREQAAEISFIVRANDTNGMRGIQTATTSVIITILGTDLKSITFSPPWSAFRPEYTFSLTESRVQNVSIMTLYARDPACGYCVLQNYIKLSESTGSNDDYFQVNPTSGEIRLKKALDYENRNSRVLRVVVEARSADNRVATATVIIEVLDDNDNSPEFVPPTGYEFTLGESSIYPTTVGSLFARDDDSGSFGMVEYSLSGQNAFDFKIYPETGLIIIAEGTVLDHEKRKVYNLQATATDNPQYLTTTSEIRKQSSVLLRINILDENDNKPSFGNTAQYEFFTVESYRVGRTIGQVVATDIDSGTNAQIIYSIESATAEVTNLFRINTFTGDLTTIQKLRGASARSPFVLYVRARDRGQPSQSTAVKVLIHVSSGQLDDGTPYWSYPIIDQVIDVKEHSAIGTPVVTAFARARTPGANIIYSFLTTTNQDFEKFAIDSGSGEVTVNGDIDREIQARYVLIVSARDSINQSQSYRLLHINILDKNDNSPAFQANQTYRACRGTQISVPVEISMQEELPRNTPVYTVTACDPDAAPNNKVLYYPEFDVTEDCAKEMNKFNFFVTLNGKIFTNKTLNREDQETYLICVRVRADTSNSSRRKRASFDKSLMINRDRVAYIQVTLTDINDNRPIFPGRVLQTVLLSVPTSDIVLQVRAIDSDASPFNRVLYTITNIQYFAKTESFQLPGAFAVNPDTGLITVGFSSYSEFSGRYFKVDILAQDFYNSALNSTTSVYIHIFDKVQSMRFVLNEVPEDGKNKAHDIIKELNDASIVNKFTLQQISYHSKPNGQTDVTKTDICFVVVAERSVLTVQQGERQLEADNIQEILDKYGVVDTGSCYLASSSTEFINWGDLWWTLVAVACFIFLCCIILIIAVFILHRNYKRYMNTRKTYMVPQ